MAYQAVFKRYELKYMLTQQQKERVLAAMEPYMALDRYGRTTVRNIYFDTDSYRLIRHSIEKPAYKEKLRIRSYAKARADSDVFVELKKKYGGVVYKRRLAMGEEKAMEWIAGGSGPEEGGQIAREIEYFCSYYENLHPVAFLSYEREAYYCRDGGEFRVTFDDNILSRGEELTLEADPWGEAILPEGKVLMETKCAGGIPLWLVRVLSREGIYKTSFSKYGTAYEKLIFPTIKGGPIHA